MGLNLNIEHVAFSSLKKFDGRLIRNLNLSEEPSIIDKLPKVTLINNACLLFELKNSHL